MNANKIKNESFTTGARKCSPGRAIRHGTKERRLNAFQPLSWCQASHFKYTVNKQSLRRVSMVMRYLKLCRVIFLVIGMTVAPSSQENSHPPTHTPRAPTRPHP